MDIIVNRDCDALPDGCKLIHGYNDYFLNALASLGFPPLAALSAYHHKLDGQWIAASPIHWEATHNDAMIVATGEELGLDDNESQRLFHAFAEFVKDDRFHPVYHSKDLWLMRVDGRPPLKSPSPQALLHRSLMPLLADMDETLYWQRLFTEIQMFFNGLDSRVNGLWFWGDKAEALTQTIPSEIFSDDRTLSEWNLAKIKTLDQWKRPQKKQILILAHPSDEDLSFYIKKTQNQEVNWFWNNLAYQSQAKSWWRTLFYAH